jgi:drug/metabolite transporter (DMT)-like permease
MSEQYKDSIVSEGFSVIDLLLVIMTVIWAVNPIVIKIAQDQFSVWSFVGLRTVLAGAAFLLLIAGAGVGWRVEKKDIPRLLLASFLGTTLVQFTYLCGYKYTTASNGTLIFATTPLFIALIGLFRGEEKISVKGWAGIFLSIAGIALLLSKDLSLSHMSLYFTGDLLMLASTLFWASYSVIVAPLLKDYSPLKITGLTTIIGSLPLCIISIPALLTQQWHMVDLRGWGGLLFSSLFALVLTFVIWNMGIKKVGAVKTSLYMNVKPFITVLIAIMFLGEIFSIPLIYGGLLILAGLVMGRVAGLEKK